MFDIILQIIIPRKYILCSYPRFIIYNLPLKKPVLVLATMLAKATIGISRMARLWLRKRRRQCARSLAHCFNVREWICCLQSSLVNFLYQCRNRYTKQQKPVCVAFMCFSILFPISKLIFFQYCFCFSYLELLYFSRRS